MGGGQSLSVGLNHPERFGWVGAFSAAVFNPETALAAALKDPKATDSAFRVIWIACGKDDRLIAGNQRLADLLKNKAIHHEFLATEGNHSWPVWRRYLAQFVAAVVRREPLIG